MKKVLLVILMMFFYVSAQAQIINVTNPVCTSVSNGTEVVECKYDNMTAVAAGVTQEFRLTTDRIDGFIQNLIISNSSTDFDFWISSDNGTDQYSNDTFIVYETKDRSFSPDWATPRDFINNDNQKFLYLTVKNDALVTTGVIDLTLTLIH